MIQQYNTFQYNALMYNANVINLAMFETQGTADTAITPYEADILREETQSSVDTVTKVAEQAALPEIVMVDGVFITEPDLNIFNTLLLVEQVITFTTARTLSETQTMTANLLNQPNKRLSEFIFLATGVQREITNKALNESIKVNVWLSVLRRPAVSSWEG